MPTKKVNFLLFCLSMLLCLALPSAYAGCRNLEIELFSAHKPLRQVFFRGPCRILYPRLLLLPYGHYQVLKEQNCFLVKKGEQIIFRGSRLVLKGVSEKALYLDLKPDISRRYLGSVSIAFGNDGDWHLENQIDAANYAACVVASETNAFWPLEALKAQAVLTNTRLYHLRPGEIIPDSTEYEVYFGAGHLRRQVIDACQSVKGKILFNGKQPAEVFYHSTCAGATSRPEDIFGGKGQDRQSGVKCRYCAASPFFSLKQTIFPKSCFEAWGGLPTVSLWDRAGRPLWLSFPGAKKVSGYNFWLWLGKKYGFDKVPGTRYTIKSLPGANVEIDSTGAGHGVGLCQWGAGALAARGKTYRQILKFYFPNLNLVSP